MLLLFLGTARSFINKGTKAIAKKMIEDKKYEVLNPNKENLTVEKLRTFKGLENLSDEDAQETVFAIQTLANILYDFTIEQKNKNQGLKIAA